MTPLPNYGYKGNKKHLHLHVKGFRDSDYASRKPKSSDFKGYLTPIQMATKGWLSGWEHRLGLIGDGGGGGAGRKGEGECGGRRWWWRCGGEAFGITGLICSPSLLWPVSIFTEDLLFPNQHPSAFLLCPHHPWRLWALGCFVRHSTVLLAPTKYINERSGAWGMAIIAAGWVGEGQGTHGCFPPSVDFLS